MTRTYNNPDGVIDDDNTRKIIIRFATKQDFDNFVKNSNLNVTPNTTEVTLPQSKALSDLFDI